VLIAQITDCHVVAPGELVADRVDSAAALEETVRRINALARPPTLVVATGDLVNDERPDQYDRFQEIVAGLSVPLVPVPGNHDDRSELRARFPGVLPDGGPDDPIDHVLDLGPLQLVFLDTQVPGRIGGAIRERQVAWLDDVLSAAPDRPTVVFQHHPPFETGIGFMDHESFEGGEAYAPVLARHRQVQLVSCGHLHRTIVHRFAGTVACTWPSTCVTLDLGLGETPIRYTDEPSGFVLHQWEPAVGLRSHLVPLGSYDRWTPSWATGGV
jgi:3',5'-cyclic AMP phosphodiesterase CpdA